MDAVPVFVDYTKSAEDIESIVDTPLHIFEVHVHIPVLVDLKDSLGYLGAGCLSMIHYLFKDFFGKKNQLFRFRRPFGFLKWISLRSVPHHRCPRGSDLLGV